MNSLQKGNCITAIAGDYRRRYSIITLLVSLWLFRSAVDQCMHLQNYTCTAEGIPSVCNFAINLNLFKMAVRERSYAALLVLLLSFLIFVAVRYADSPSDPEVDYDAVS